MPEGMILRVSAIFGSTGGTISSVHGGVSEVDCCVLSKVQVGT